MSDPAHNDETPALPRFSRDISVTGPTRNATPAPRHWTGVRQPFHGVLDPGIATGEWPPAALSHLTLGDLLAGALASGSGAGAGASGPSRSGSVPDGNSETDSPTDPTVREVLREGGETTPEGEPAPADATGAASRDPARAGTSEQTLDRPIVRVDRPVEASAPGDGLEDRREAATPTPVDADGPEASGEPPGATDPRLVVAPRTVVQQAGSGPAPPTRLTGPADTRAAEWAAPRTRAETARTGAGDPGETDAGDRMPIGAGAPRDPASTLGLPWSLPPVERTVPTVPAGFGTAGGPAGADRTGGRPPIPEVARSDAGGETTSPDTPRGLETRDVESGPDRTGEAPSLTVLAGVSSGTVDDGNEVGDEGTDSSGDRAAEIDGREGAVTGEAVGPSAADAAGVSDSATASLLEAVAAGDDAAVQRALADAVSRPRVVDRLYSELQRRRRIERERGGRR